MHDRTPDSDLIDLYLLHLTNHVALRTIETYATALRRAHRELPAGLARACPDELEEWIWAHKAWSTRGTYRAAVVGFFAWAVRAGHLDYSPAGDLPRVRSERRYPRPATDEQVQRILEHAAPPVWLYSLIAAYGGARCCEIAALNRGDVTEQTLRLFGKGAKERLLPTHPAIWAAVQDLPPGPVAGGATAREISRRCRTEYARLGLDGPPAVTAHRLRHWAGTTWYTATGDLRLVQEMMGHASPTTTAGYTAVAPAAMRAAVAAAPAWGSGGLVAAGQAAAPAAAGAPQ